MTSNVYPFNSRWLTVILPLTIYHHTKHLLARQSVEQESKNKTSTMGGQYGLIYRLLFFWIEPFFALGGVYLTHFTPVNYFSKLIPGNNDPIFINTQLVLTNLASSYIHFTIVE